MGIRDAGDAQGKFRLDLLIYADRIEVKDKAVSATETAKDGIADRLDDVAKAIHSSSQQLEGQQDWIAHIVERGN